MSRKSKGGKLASKQENLCSICMIRAVNCKTIECSHEFCYRCLSKWGRRKGNCPLCRQNIRKILRNKKIIEPQFLKIFDEEKITDEQLAENYRRHNTYPYPIPAIMPFYGQFFTPQSIPLMQTPSFFPLLNYFP